jgi:arylsulfatase A-like enzyme
MNPHSRSLFTLPIHAWFGFVSFTNLMVRKRCLLSLLVAGITALVVVLMATQPISPASAHPAQPAPHTARLPQPNIVFIITDDQDTETLKYMPRVKRLLADEGISFTNMFVTTPQCCPSHVTILTGKYPHNSGVLNNWFDSGGGFQTFVNNGGDKSTIATWLQAAGYRTARFGKYLVEYDNTTYIPPGWSEWYAYYGSGKYFNYTLNENGTRVAYGNAPSDYSTDVLTEKVIDFIGRTEENEPFFVFFAPAAPHGDGVPNGPATPAPRHKGMFAGTQAPRTPSFNEADVSDKPPAISSLPLLTAAQITAIDSEYQTRLESLQSVDEAVESIVNKLAALGQLENTYVIFTSDNGYHLGQHRLRNGKTQVYEEDIRVPLIVRGPKAPVATTRDHLVVTIDFAPTLAKLAHVQPDHTVDGQSFVDLFDDHPPSPKEWRKDFLLEVYRRLPPLGNGDAIRALRSLDGLLYVEYDSGPRELYDLTQDPYELESQHDVAPPGHLKKLSRRLAELATCAGHTCQEPTWSATGSLGTARLQHTATLLANGKVLVVGGVIRCNPGCSTTGSAELYDPATGTWSYTGNLNTARRLHTATLLANGQVLVAGGTSGKDVLNSAELYDPATGTWSSTGNLNTARDGHTATLLSTGKVLVAGGR